MGGLECPSRQQYATSHATEHSAGSIKYSCEESRILTLIKLQLLQADWRRLDMVYHIPEFQAVASSAHKNQDVKDLVFHLVFHTLCKFCIWEIRILEWTEMPVTTTSLYKRAFEGIQFSEDITCDK